METFDIAELAKLLEKGGVEFSRSQDALFKASLDHTRYSALPAGVAFAASEGDVSKILFACNKLGIPATVRGSGTGCAGGCVPICGGIVLDISRLNFIEIDPVSRIAHAGAGAITADIDAAARKFGLFYAPDPSSHKFSSIGGNIACNAGGLRALKYGTTRENLLALKAVLASGEIISGALALKKYSVGLNLRDILVGSEGTLAVITRAWLRLLPLPESRSAAAAFFPSDEAALRGVEKIMRANLSPSVFEMMDAETCACVRKRNPDLQVPENSAALLAQFDGEAGSAQAQAKAFADVLADSAVAVSYAVEPEKMEKLWAVRRASSQAMFELGSGKFSQDIVLPYGAVAEFFKFYKALGAREKMATPVFGHVGDGNYHIHFMYDLSDKTARRRAMRAMDEAVAKAVELGGAVSGEHGVGFLKSKYMPLQHTRTELELMRGIKKLFDPHDILNRGKVYGAADISEMEPLSGVRLPWD
ncbi:MAG: FAD-binding protein [Opitutales bacterium]|nr:FAD-binding protein [Opitutales bacterium]